MNPENYHLESSDKMKKFILSRIDKTDEINGLKFKENKMSASQSGMPQDIYNAIIMNYALRKNTRIYLKFYVTHDFCDAFFVINYMSVHDDKNQNEI